MTDNEIKKALECCRDCKCKECPCYNEETNGCKEIDEQDILDLINRQQAENTEKDEVIQAQADKIFLYERVIKDKTAEIERLEKLTDAYFKVCIGMTKELIVDDKELEKIKSEAKKEFAERLCEGRVSNDPVVIAVKTELKMMEGNQ